VADGTVLADTLQWVKFSGLSWLGDDALVYSRFPEPGGSDAFHALNYNQASLAAHRTPQQQDRAIFSTPDFPGRCTAQRSAATGAG
jgi:prolyl oligopeptidase